MDVGSVVSHLVDTILIESRPTSDLICQLSRRFDRSKPVSCTLNNPETPLASLACELRYNPCRARNIRVRFMCSEVQDSSARIWGRRVDFPNKLRRLNFGTV